MATIYRNGTYIAFHANGTNFPIGSDIKYYNLIKAWSAKKDDDFSFVNSHEKTFALRSNSSKESLKSRLSERLRNYSKNMVLIISDTTKNDRDWVPFEISYAIDMCHLPIIVTYIDYEYILSLDKCSKLWPKELKERIEGRTASCIHIPFKKLPLLDAISQFNLNNKPNGQGYGIYSKEAYEQFGITIS